VRVAPNQKMAADGWVSPWGRGTATTAVRNAPGRAAVARSPAWMRGSSLGQVQRRARERKGEESAAAVGGFLQRRRRGRGAGVWGGGCRMEGGNGEERGGPGRDVGQRGGAATVRLRRVWEAWCGHVTRPAEQGRGEGADRWAAAIVPGAGTG
jgi:hypothetical protein